MHDLVLFRELQTAELSAARLLPLLGQLVEKPLEDRLPFLGAMHRLVDSADADLRVAALRVLGGVTGALGIRSLVKGLNDENARVRSVAVEALRQSAQHDGPRWAHALFHHNPRVRRAALDGEQPDSVRWYTLFAAADPENAPLVAERLNDLTPPVHTLPTIAQLVSRDCLPRATARLLVSRIASAVQSDWLTNGRRRSRTEVERILTAAGTADDPQSLGTEVVDDLDVALSIFWDAEAEDEVDPKTSACPVRVFFDGFIEQVLTVPAFDQDALLAALIVTAARRGGWIPAAAELGLLLDLSFLFYPWVPRDVRRQAAQVFYRLGLRTPELPLTTVERVIQSDEWRRPSQNLDLWLCGALLHGVKSQPLSWFVDVVGMGRVISAFWENMQESASLLSVEDKSKRGRQFFVEELVQWRKPQRCALFARLVYFVQADGFDFLEGLSTDEAIAVAGELLTGELRHQLLPSENKRYVAAELLAPQIVSGGAISILQWLREWFALPDPEASVIGRDLLEEMLPLFEADVLREVVRRLDAEDLPVLLRLLQTVSTVSVFLESALKLELQSHPNPALRKWAEPPEVPRPTLPIIDEAEPLSNAEAEWIAACDVSALSAAVKSCLEQPRSGLTAALSRRLDVAPNIAVCTALLGCVDSPASVDRQFVRYFTDTPAFLAELESEVVRTWQGRKVLSPLGHAWLYRWERHAFAYAQIAAITPDGLPQWLADCRRWENVLLGQNVWWATARVVALWRYRDRAKLQSCWNHDLAERALDALGTAYGEPAAELLRHAWHAKVMEPTVESLRPAIFVKTPDLSEAERNALRPILGGTRSIGLPVEHRPVKSAVASERRREIETSDDLDWLTECLGEVNATLADAAAMRLLEYGTAGAERILTTLRRTPPVSAAMVLAETVSLWPEELRMAAAELLADATLPAPLRFLIGLNLLESGNLSVRSAVIEVVCSEDATTSWFRPEYWQRLLAASFDEWQLSLAVVLSPQPHAYLLAVRQLMQSDDELACEALARFVELGDSRFEPIRLEAGRYLARHGDFRAFPLLVRYAIENRDTTQVNPFVGADPSWIADAVTAGLTAGTRLCDERTLYELLAGRNVDSGAQQQGFEQLLSRGTVQKVRELILSHLTRTASRTRKLRAVAEDFAWGVRIGRELTGRLFSVKMIGSEDLGYTRLEDNVIYINPLPILRGERHAHDVVRGLILHEYGHHLYHRGEEPQRIWKEAHDEGLGRLLNLVSDEHLERNLRALDVQFGDRLKRLAAYAFQHSQKEMPVARLLAALQSWAFDVLSASRLHVARNAGCVVVENGQILQEMEHTGLSFARFVRALRMGLGNRHEDPRVAAGLALFKKSFRKSDMPTLQEIARKLRDIFGAETAILDSFGQDDWLCPDPSELQAHGEGITDAEIESEIRRITDPKRPPRDSDTSQHGRGGARWINVSAEEQFETIDTVVPVPYDPAAHRRYAEQVARPARRLRQYLTDLGIGLVQRRMRLQGRLLDRTRIPAMVLRGDPRMLIAREKQIRNDVFLGVVVDCSGSMDYHGNIEKAKMFGALLAEAAHGLDSVELRLFGFTDQVIYDAGDSRRPAAHGLQAGGGNNDAAGLWYAAQVALASSRKAKVLVMISDGLPTECSVPALRGLVTRLTTRHGICCAQVAVQNLEEVCFPHYILLDEADVDASVRKFGSVVAGLVRRTLGR